MAAPSTGELLTAAHSMPHSLKYSFSLESALCAIKSSLRFLMKSWCLVAHCVNKCNGTVILSFYLDSVIIIIDRKLAITKECCELSAQITDITTCPLTSIAAALHSNNVYSDLSYSYCRIVNSELSHFKGSLSSLEDVNAFGSSLFDVWTGHR